jgi:hypothetical protein
VSSFRATQIHVLFASCASGQLPGNERQVNDVHAAVAIYIGSWIEAGLTGFLAEGCFDDRQVSAIDDAVAIEVAVDGFDVDDDGSMCGVVVCGVRRGKCRRQGLRVASRKDGSSGRGVDKRAGDVGRGVELGRAEWGAKPEVERIAPGNGGRGFGDGERTGDEDDRVIGRGDAGAGDGKGTAGDGACWLGGSEAGKRTGEGGEVHELARLGSMGNPEYNRLSGSKISVVWGEKA